MLAFLLFIDTIILNMRGQRHPPRSLQCRIACLKNRFFVLIDSGGNVMMTKDSMTLKVLDFGMATKLRRGLQNFDHKALKKDILCVIQLFRDLYHGQEYKDNIALKSDIETEMFEKVCEWTFCFHWVGIH